MNTFPTASVPALASAGTSDRLPLFPVKIADDTMANGIQQREPALSLSTAVIFAIPGYGKNKKRLEKFSLLY
jgi:hypothetical protein